MGFIKEFKEFAMKGNVMDMAVGVIIGGAFGKIVTSLVNDVLMPIIGQVTGGVSFVDLFFNFSGGTAKTLAAAQEAQPKRLVTLFSLTGSLFRTFSTLLSSRSVSS